MSPEPSPTAKSLIYLSAAAAAFGGFWAWAFFRALAIDLYFPQDSRVGIVLVLCLPILVMAFVYEFRIWGMVARCKSEGVRLPLSRPAFFLFAALNLTAIACVLSSAVYNPLLAVSFALVVVVFLFDKIMKKRALKKARRQGETRPPLSEEKSHAPEAKKTQDRLLGIILCVLFACWFLERLILDLGSIGPDSPVYLSAGAVFLTIIRNPAALCVVGVLILLFFWIRVKKKRSKSDAASDSGQTEKHSA